MANIFFTPSGTEAQDRKIRRDAEAGRLKRVIDGIYVENGEPVEDVVLRNWLKIVGHIVPGAVVSDRTVIEGAPWRDRSSGQPSGNGYVFVVAPRSRATIDLPGLRIAIRPGAGPQPGDIPFPPSTYLAGVARRLLDNLAPSRSRGGPARTLGQVEVEKKLAAICTLNGEDHLNGLRDEARIIAPKIDRETESEKLDNLIGALLKTRNRKLLRTTEGRARGLGVPHDPDCLKRMTLLVAAMQERAPLIIKSTDTTDGKRLSGAFVEAYFSNYIEGTTFLVEEAREIVFEGKIPERRPEDAHDVLGTYLRLVEGKERSVALIGADQFLEEIKEHHGHLMSARPSLMPGQFKTMGNQAGNTVFVAPELVEGTLRDGLLIVQSVSDPFRRALALHFLLSEVHPFADGNGRLSRIMMSRELAAAGLSRIVIPTVFRNSYLDGQRALSRRNDPAIYIRNMEFCQEVSASCSGEPLDAAIRVWASTYAFCEDERHARLTKPNASLRIQLKDGIPAPDGYWEAVSRESTLGLGL
ncbi:MAG: Fic family protein [Parvibaculaceae bacterium]